MHIGGGGTRIPMRIRVDLMSHLDACSITTSIGRSHTVTSCMTEPEVQAVAPAEAAGLVQKIVDEGAMPLSKAVRGLATPNTGVRWHYLGITGPHGERVYLEAIRVGGKLHTSRQAVLRFLEKLQPQADGSDLATRSPSARRRSADAAGAELSKMGV
jgi:hypothetical protein